MLVGRALMMAALCASCRYADVFVCQTDEQCRHGATPGRCEPVGFCSFPDGACTSGYRFDDNSGVGYAGRCVGEEMPPPDSAPPKFDIKRCPPTYDVQIASTSVTSRYRVIVDSQSWWTHAASCDADLADATHLALVESRPELTELLTALDAVAPETYFVGAVQDPAATAVADAWLLLDDTPLVPELWGFTEPDDNDGVEDHATQLGFIDKVVFTRGLADGSGAVVRGALCECDGKRYGATARAFVDTDPNNPN